MKGPEKKRAKIAIDPSSERQMVDLQRRLLLRGGLSLGALAMLSGCRLGWRFGRQGTLGHVALERPGQAWLFSRTRLAPTFDPSQVASPFPFNAFYPAYNVPEIDLPEYRLQVSGRVRDKRPWSLEQLRRLPQASQVTQLICIEGWSAIGQWSGAAAHLSGAGRRRHLGEVRRLQVRRPLLLQPRHAQRAASADPAGAGDVRAGAAGENGYPLRLRIPTKLGFKNAKHVVEIFVSNSNPGGYWEDQGYNWFSGV